MEPRKTVKQARAEAQRVLDRAARRILDQQQAAAKPATKRDGEMGGRVTPEGQRILDGIARRLLAEELENRAKGGE